MNRDPLADFLRVTQAQWLIVENGAPMILEVRLAKMIREWLALEAKKATPNKPDAAESGMA